MEFIAILEIIMAIIAMIMEMLGGGTFDRVLIPDEPAATHLASYQVQCDDTHWLKMPNVEDGRFNGTVALDCEVEGVSGGGLIGLRRHMVNQIPRTTSTVHAGPLVKNFEGLPSHAYDATLEFATEEEAYIRGEINIATNGFTVLRNVFTAKDIPTKGSLGYLKKVTDEVEVRTADREGWYQVRMIYSTQIKKPWYISSKPFKDKVVEMLEERMDNRRDRVLNDLAGHL